MAIDRETLKAVAGLRIAVAASVDTATRQLVRDWVLGWDVVAGQWQAAVDELVAASAGGRWPSRSQVLRAQRVQAALEVTYAELQGLSARAGVTVMASVEQAVQAAAGQLDVIATQLPPSQRAWLGANLNRADPQQIGAILERTRGPVTSLIPAAANRAHDMIRTQLVRGVALGDNPRVTARWMVRALEGRFNFGLQQALVVARTETLDAHRAAERAHELANADMLSGWQWMATLDTRTCPSCLANHGSIHPLEAPGPEDHPQGRCARVPKTKTWRELGFDMDEPANVFPDRDAWFDGLPEADQLKILGPKRLELLRAGDIGWDDLTTRRQNPGWRPSQVVTPLSALPA